LSYAPACGKSLQEGNRIITSNARSNERHHGPRTQFAAHFYLHLGMNVSTPTTALATTSRAGLILYCIRISNTATAIAPVSRPVIAPFAMLKQPASSSPIDTGASPC